MEYTSAFKWYPHYTPLIISQWPKIKSYICPWKDYGFHLHTCNITFPVLYVNNKQMCMEELAIISFSNTVRTESYVSKNLPKRGHMQTWLIYFMFMVPCIIIFYEITNRCKYVQSILFHCYDHSTGFGCFIHLSSGVQFFKCIYSDW